MKGMTYLIETIDTRETETREILGIETAGTPTVIAVVGVATQEVVAGKDTILVDGKNPTLETLNFSEVSLTGKIGTEKLLIKFQCDNL